MPLIKLESWVVHSANASFHAQNPDPSLAKYFDIMSNDILRPSMDVQSDYLEINNYYDFNTFVDINTISQTENMHKFIFLRITRMNVSYLTYLPKNRPSEERFRVIFLGKYMPNDQHTRECLKGIKLQWKKAFRQIMNTLTNQQSIIIPINTFSSANEIYEKQLSYLTNNSIMFSYCSTYDYLLNINKYHTILLPRYYTDPFEYFEMKDSLLSRNGNNINDRKKPIAVFRGALTNGFRFELWKICYFFGAKYNLDKYLDVKLTNIVDDDLENYLIKPVIDKYRNCCIVEKKAEAEAEAEAEVPNDNGRDEKSSVSSVGNVSNVSDETLLRKDIGEYYSFDDQIDNFQFVIHIDGWSCASRLPKYLTAGFVVLWLQDWRHNSIDATKNMFVEDWYQDLIPFKHFIPIQWVYYNKNSKNKQIEPRKELLWKMNNLINAIKYLQNNPNIVTKISNNAQQFMKSSFTLKAINERVVEIFSNVPRYDKRIGKTDGIQEFLTDEENAKMWKLEFLINLCDQNDTVYQPKDKMQIDLTQILCKQIVG